MQATQPPSNTIHGIGTIFFSNQCFKFLRGREFEKFEKFEKFSKRVRETRTKPTPLKRNKKGTRLLSPFLEKNGCNKKKIARAIFVTLFFFEFFDRFFFDFAKSQQTEEKIERMDYGNQETDEMLFKNCFAKIEEENCLLEKQLIEIWGDLETPSSMKESFLKDLSLSFSQTLSGMVQREENKRAQMAEEVKKVIECCQEVGLKIGKCDQLSQFDSFKTHQHPFSLVVRKKEAMSLLSEMKEEARIRSEKRDSLLSQLNTLSNELEFPLNVGKKGGLSDDELQKLEEEIEKLLSLKSTRLNQLKIITKEIKGLWNEVKSFFFPHFLCCPCILNVYFFTHTHQLGKPSEKDDFYHKIVNFQLNPTQQELDKVQQKKEELQLTRSQRVSQIRVICLFFDFPFFFFSF